MYPFAVPSRLSSRRANGSPGTLEGESAMKIQTNEAPIDRVVRVVVGVALLAVAVVGVVASPLSWIAGAVGAVLVVTGATGFCPLYALLGVSTCPAKQ
jgi:Inner membrane protein YgaP-like, transmembrane domain